MTTTCQRAIQIQNRQAKNRKTWRDPKWIQARKIWVAQNPVCYFCGRPTITGHHPTLDHYGRPEYIDLYLSECIPVCRSCHYPIGHKGLFLCQHCKRGYVFIEGTRCNRCLTDEEKEEREIRKIMARKRRKVLEREARKRWKCQNPLKNDKRLKFPAVKR